MNKLLLSFALLTASVPAMALKLAPQECADVTAILVERSGGSVSRANRTASFGGLTCTTRIGISSASTECRMSGTATQDDQRALFEQVLGDSAEVQPILGRDEVPYRLRVRLFCNDTVVRCRLSAGAYECRLIR